MSRPSTPDSSADQTYSAYYSHALPDQNASKKFQNLDDVLTFAAFYKSLERPQTRNFVLDFGGESAWAALDLGSQDLSAVLKRPRPPGLSTRWINIWGPEAQKGLVKAIAGHYDFSLRLHGIMCSDPSPSRQVPPSGQQSDIDDLEVQEKGANGDLDEESAHGINQPATVEEDKDKIPHIGHYQIVNDIWQFFSVDYGRKYDCIGYNSLYTVDGVSFASSRSVPDCKRVWTWLMLCDGGTVITIHENPFPFSNMSSVATDSKDSKSIRVIRKNTLNVFRQISRTSGDDSEKNPVMTLQVGQSLRPGHERAGQVSRDMPSLLFYYIFDDWYSAYNLVLQKGHQYETRLEELRESMFEKPMVDLVEELHLLGRQLSMLKRIYESYILIIDRLLQRQRGLRDEARSRIHSPPETTSRIDSVDHFGLTKNPLSPTLLKEEAPLGVPLSATSIVRFERLRDRIKLYALSQIEECLLEKESLVFLNFNLIALKESQAVEKLTRITILLAKATILFLPVSLMTGYFSVQIQDLAGVYTVTTYWVCFTVIVALSIIGLIGFGVLSGTVEGKPIYKSLTRTFFDRSKDKVDRRRKKNR